jgi:hypothetical protein
VEERITALVRPAPTLRRDARHRSVVDEHRTEPRAAAVPESRSLTLRVVVAVADERP